MSVKTYTGTLITIALMAIAAWQLVFDTRIVSDPGAFIPSTSSERHKILLQELRQGASGRVWLIAVENDSPQVLADINRTLAAELKKTGKFNTVLNGAAQLDEAVLATLMQHRYMLNERSTFSVKELHEGLMQRLEDLRSPLSTFGKEMITADPTGSLLDLQKQFSAQPDRAGLHQGVWFSDDRTRTFLIAETKATGLDLDAQENIQRSIDGLFNQARGSSQARLLTSGAPVIALATRDRIRSDSQKFSLIASVIVLGILFLAYRQWSVALFSVIPLAVSAVLATALVSAVFGNVHGITLAFGITLLGVAVDYPVHLLSHRNTGEDLSQAARKIWPVIRIGALTTGLGYSSMLFAGFEGLVQLGLFSVAGIFTSLLVTRYVLPELGRFVSRSGGSKPDIIKALASPPFSGGWVIAMAMAGVCAIILMNADQVLSEDLSELSPIPAGMASRDRLLRAELGVAEPRFVVFVKGENIEAVLRQQEQVLPLLRERIAAGDLATLNAAAQMLPSTSTQRQRQQALPDKKTLAARMDRALVGTPFRPGTFDKFLADVERSRTMQPLLLENLSGTAIRLSLDSLLHQRSGYALGIMRLGGVSGPQRISDVIERFGNSNIWFVDLKHATGQHVREFSYGMLGSIGLALGVIVLVLIVTLRVVRRIVQVVLPVSASVLLAAAVPILLGDTLNLFHLVSLLLVAGLGVDYALFFTQRWRSEEDRLGTIHSLVVCSLSTIGVFATLSVSEIPVLHSIGLTVAVGALCSFILSWASSRKLS